MAQAMSMSRLLAELRKNPELLSAIRDHDDSELSSIALSGEQTLNVSRKTVDDTSDETIEEIRDALVSLAVLVTEHVKAAGTSGDNRVGIPFETGDGRVGQFSVVFSEKNQA